MHSEIHTTYSLLGLIGNTRRQFNKAEVMLLLSIVLFASVLIGYILDQYLILNVHDNPEVKRRMQSLEINIKIAKYITVSDIVVSLTHTILTFILVKVHSRRSLLKRLTTFSAVIFVITEFISLIIYVSVYSKSFDIDILLHKLTAGIRITYLTFAVVLVVLHFLNWIVLLYKIKQLIILNLSSDYSSDNNFFSCNYSDYELNSLSRKLTAFDNK